MPPKPSNSQIQEHNFRFSPRCHPQSARLPTKDSLSKAAINESVYGLAQVAGLLVNMNAVARKLFAVKVRQTWKAVTTSVQNLRTTIWIKFGVLP